MDGGGIMNQKEQWFFDHGWTMCGGFLRKNSSLEILVANNQIHISTKGRLLVIVDTIEELLSGVRAYATDEIGNAVNRIGEAHEMLDDLND